jgi:hypothetical protein
MSDEPLGLYSFPWLALGKNRDAMRTAASAAVDCDAEETQDGKEWLAAVARWGTQLLMPQRSDSCQGHG